MGSVLIDDLEDPRLDAYRDIRSRNWTYVSKRFIAEGPLLTERLLASEYETESVLLDQKYATEYLPMIPESVEVLLLEHSQIEQILGFNFHRGVLACGVRPQQLELRANFGALPSPQETIVAAIGVQDPENLGSILRCCAGFGISRVIIGPGTADPLARRVLRVSMGTALRLRLLHSKNVVADLAWLRESGVTTYATSLRDDSQPLEKTRRTGPVLILVGNERYGLPEDVQQAADQCVRIDMELGTDSLNVSMASGIVMHYFCRIAGITR
ncbi:MAG: RNA methyltransferase [Pirellulaceae bacterium]|nr:RNA methyltransferase [Pirellulaceae bacterium]